MKTRLRKLFSIALAPALALCGAQAVTPNGVSTEFSWERHPVGPRLTFDVSEAEAIEPLEIATESLPDGAPGVFYSRQLQAGGGQEPHYWYLPDGLISLPPGLDFSTDGLLSGTPSASGTFVFAVGVYNLSPYQQATRSLSLTISEGASRLKWRYETGSAIYYGSPALNSDGTIYVATSYWPFYSGSKTGPGLYAIHPDGTLKWEYLTDRNMFSPALGDDGTIYVQDETCSLYAIRSDGTLKWKYALNVPPTLVGMVTPAVGVDGTVYIGASRGVHAVGPDGLLKWTYDTLILEPVSQSYFEPNTIRSSPAVATDGTIHVGAHGGGLASLFALHPDGTLKWQSLLAGANFVFSSPAIAANGTVYLGAETSTGGDLSFVFAVNADGTEKWRHEISGGRQVRSSPAIGKDGTVYAGTKASWTQEAEMLALNPDGTLKWGYTVERVHSTPDDVYSSPAIGADGTIYFAAETGSVYALNPDGTLSWEHNLHSVAPGASFTWPSPVVDCSGMVYIGDMTGNLYALQSASSGLANSAWPRFQGGNRTTGRRIVLHLSVGEVVFAAGRPETLVLRWPTLAGQRYALEFTPSLPAVSWQQAGDEMAGTGGMVTFTDDSLEAPARFYRLRMVRKRRQRRQGRIGIPDVPGLSPAG